MGSSVCQILNCKYLYQGCLYLQCDVTELGFENHCLYSTHVCGFMQTQTQHWIFTKYRKSSVSLVLSHLHCDLCVPIPNITVAGLQDPCGLENFIIFFQPEFEETYPFALGLLLFWWQMPKLFFNQKKKNIAKPLLKAMLNLWKLTIESVAIIMDLINKCPKSTTWFIIFLNVISLLTSSMRELEMEGKQGAHVWVNHTYPHLKHILIN
jgi:hypothetical protein